MNGFKPVRTAVTGLIVGSRRANRHPNSEEDALPSSEFEAARARPIDRRPALDDARDAIRRQNRA
jgi:hypothetical protein